MIYYKAYDIILKTAVIIWKVMHQHIDCTDMHTIRQEQYNVHAVTSIGDNAVSALYGREFFANSAHHQAIKKLGEGLEASLMAGHIVEGIEHSSLPIIGVQWHPEKMCFSQSRADTVDGARLFHYFIELCRNRRLIKNA